MAPTEPRYVCSRCGFSRAEPKAVVEHIHDTHEDEGRVMEYEGTPTAAGPLGRLAVRLRDWLP